MTCIVLHIDKLVLRGIERADASAVTGAPANGYGGVWQRRPARTSGIVRIAATDAGSHARTSRSYR